MGKELKEKLELNLVPDIDGSIPTVFWSKLSYNFSEIVIKDYKEFKVNTSITKDSGVILMISLPELSLEGNTVGCASIGKLES